MKNFTKRGGFNDRRGGGGFARRDSRGGGFDRRGDDSGRPEMHRVVCAECGDSCEVPFKPTGDKPVFCSNCFKGKESSQSPRRSGGREYGRSNFQDKTMFKAVCAECGAKCEVPFKPTGDKPVLCSNCYAQDGRGGDRRSGGSNNNQLESQIKSINEKLDKILQALLPSSSKSVDTKFKAEVVIEDKKKKSIAKSGTKKKAVEVKKAKRVAKRPAKK